MMTETTETTPAARANQRGCPCPPWCAADHARPLPSGVLLQGHESAGVHLDAGPPGGVIARLRQSGFSAAAQPMLRLYAAPPDAADGSVEVTFADDARGLAALVLAARAMDDALAAELAAALGEMAAALPEGSAP